MGTRWLTICQMPLADAAHHFEAWCRLNDLDIPAFAVRVDTIRVAGGDQRRYRVDLDWLAANQ